MELSIGLVLTFVTLVTATPHGYGVKGGATARAEATAVAGAFGDLGPIPLSIPSGASYSGSFAKSSSSSFASSSASSSSSSYSFSGSGANGIAQTGGSGQKGCATGSCSGIAPNGPATNGAQQIGGANAVATAQAKALSGVYLPCQGSVCNNSPVEKCSSGQCPAKSEKDSENNNGCSTGNCQSETKTKSPSKHAGSSAECASGQCEKDKQEEDINDSNDFAVNINHNSRGKSSQDVNGQHYHTQNPSGSTCSNGQCGTNSYPSYETNKQNQPPAPATYLTTPNHKEPCTTPNCGPTQDFSPQSNGLPSSYNVPIQSATNPPDTPLSSSGTSYGPHTHAYPSNKNDSPCTSPSCKSTLYTTDTQSNQFRQQNPGNRGPCVTGRCDYNSGVKPSNNFALHSPSYSHGGYPSNVPSNNLGKTDTSSYQPSQGTPTEPKNTYVPINNQAHNCKGTDCSGPSYSSSSPKPSTVDTPVYSGGFGGPGGFLDIGDNKFPVNSPKQYSPTHTPSFGVPTGTALGHSSFGITKPNEAHPESNYGSNSNGPSGTYGSTLNTVRPTVANGFNKPNLLSPTSSTQFSPSYTNTLGQQATSNTPSSTVTQPNNNYGVSPSKNNYPSSSNAYPTGSHTGSSTDSGSIHGTYGITKPSAEPNTQSSPTYTGGFGVPAGTISGSSPGAYKHVNTNCGSAGCNGQPGYGELTPFDKSNTNTPTNTDTKPIYTGGFDGPSGSIDGPSHTSSSIGGYKPQSENCGPAGCNGQKNFNGNIGSTSYDTRKPISSFSSQTTPGGFGGPTGTNIDRSSPTGSTGNYKPSFMNCGSKSCNGQPNSNSNEGVPFYDMTKPNVPNSSHTNSVNNDGFGRPTGALARTKPVESTGAYKPDTFNCGLNGCNGHPNPNSNSGTTPYDKTKPSTPNSSQTKPTYTGGFGGPSGFLKPNDYSLPSSSLGNNPCSTGTCGSKGAPSSHQNQGNSLTGTQSLAAATASANAVAYTGGFGGPPGILNAYDNGKVNSDGNSGITSPNYNPQNRGSPFANGKDNLPGNSVESGNGVYSAAHASASATASAGNYGANNIHQNNNGGSGGCNNGCPNNGSNRDGSVTPNAGSLASAKSIAGANSYGFGRSFASSSASAHATAGAGTKGGYGRK